MAASNDPVAQGYVQSLGRPGGNITGLSFQSLETTGEATELLKELVPGTAPVAVIWNKAGIVNWRAAETAARERGCEAAVGSEIRDADEIEGLLEQRLRRAPALSSCSRHRFSSRAPGECAELASKTRLPTMYELRPYVEAGGLISYGPDINDICRGGRRSTSTRS